MQATVNDEQTAPTSHQSQARSLWPPDFKLILAHMTGASPAVQVNGQAAFFVGLFRKESRDMIMEVGVLPVLCAFVLAHSGAAAADLPTCCPHCRQSAAQ